MMPIGISRPVFSKSSEANAPAVNGTGCAQYSTPCVRPVSAAELADSQVVWAARVGPDSCVGVTAPPPPWVPVTTFSAKNTLPLDGGAGDDAPSTLTLNLARDNVVVVPGGEVEGRDRRSSGDADQPRVCDVSTLVEHCVLL